VEAGGGVDFGGAVGAGDPGAGGGPGARCTLRGPARRRLRPRKKPAPDIYLLALEKLGVAPDGVLVIEDSRNGLEAARGAGLRCLITVNGYTAHEDFSEAVLVVSSLGDPGGERSVVIANRSDARPGDFVALTDLEACLRG